MLTKYEIEEEDELKLKEMEIINTRPVLRWEPYTTSYITAEPIRIDYSQYITSTHEITLEDIPF